ncbi:hypothetical protein P9112_005928 [Eukaryota sp. TZLM1-RC]
MKTLFVLLGLLSYLALASVRCCVGDLCVNSQSHIIDQTNVFYLCGTENYKDCQPECQELEEQARFHGPCTTNDQEGLPDCQAVLGCVRRQTVLARGKRWVDKGVPYSQKKTFEGYRTDCSGFVSMAWKLAKPGRTTRNLSGVSKRISKKSQIQPGDAMLNVGSHVALFVAWADKAKTKYVAYEESGSKKKAIKRVTPYPYWSGGYHPYRYNNIC